MTFLARLATLYLYIRDPRRLRFRILLPLMAGMFAVFAGVSYVMLAHGRMQVKMDEAERRVAVQSYFEHLIVTRTRVLELALDVISDSPDIRAKLIAKNRIGLLLSMRSRFRTLRKKHKITRFYFYDPQRKIILRLHQPERYGDIINRLTLLRAQATGEVASGLETGPSGALTLFVALPVEEGSKLLGYVEIGEEIGPMSVEIESALGVKLVAVLDKHYVRKSAWQAAEAAKNLAVDWSRYKNFVLASWNDPAAQSLVEQVLAGSTQSLNAIVPQRLKFDGGEFWVGLMPLKDVLGQSIGALFIIDNITALVANTRQEFVSIIGISFLLFLLLSGALYLYLRKTERTIYRQQRARVDEAVLHARAQIQATEALDAQKYRLDQAEVMARFGSWEWDVGTNRVLCSLGVQELLSYSEGSCAGGLAEVLAHIDEFEREHALTQIDLARTHKRSVTFEFSTSREDEDRIFLQGRAEPVFDERGAVVKVLGFFQDVSGVKRAEFLTRRVASIFENSWEEFYIFDSQSLKFIQVSQGALKNLGYSAEEMNAMSLLDLKLDFSLDRFRAVSLPLRRRERNVVTFTAVHRRKDGTTYPVEVRLQMFEESGRSVFVALVQDTTERDTHVQKMEYLALYDSLTGLPNRTLLHDRLRYQIDMAKRKGEAVSIIYSNVHDMREINDILGYVNGDAVLKLVGERLCSIMRDTDTVARFGGDEFVIVALGLEGKDLQNMLQKIQTKMEEPFEIGNAPLFVQVRCGVSVYPYHGRDPAQLVQQADIALHLAKQGKENWRIYDTDSNPFSLYRLHMLADLKEAVLNGAFILHYQPKIWLARDKLHGVEALIRWPRDGELVSPDEFIPLAERSGLIGPLTDWVIDEAFRQSAKWREDGHNIRISINLSARNLLDKKLPDKFIKHAKAHNMSPSVLMAEVTESAIMSHPETATIVLNAISDMGIGVSVDDYGTGYSSLSYLRALPVSELKIDQSFVRDMARDEDSATIIRSTISMAHELGLEVTAEGVESDVEAALLRDMGSDVVQGYHYSRPLSAMKFIEWLTQRGEK